MVYDQIRQNLLGQILPIKPTTLNLLVNDICNSRCQMCLIWKNKREKEFTPDELSTILQNRLFEDVKYVGVSGGEPTLRKDLPELFRVICTSLPSIKSTGIITNGILEKKIKNIVISCSNICNSYNVSFNIMVSLDGLGKIHDKVRGKNNNYNSALSLLKYFNNSTNIDTSFGCTITIDNYDSMEEFLDFVIEEKLYGRFRIAEFINRLYNTNQKEIIRSFDDKALYYLGLFFYRLEYGYENNEIFKKTYRNIRTMLTESSNRTIGCPYQTNSVVLSSRGDLLYCSPKSNLLENVIDNDAYKVYKSNISHRKEIIKNECKNCIHDYHEPITLKESFSKYYSIYKNKKFDCRSLYKMAQKVQYNPKSIDVDKINSNSVLIIGWYGTETAGDKAILWSIINDFKNRYSAPKQIYISSLYPFITNWTIKELNLLNIEIVETYSDKFIELSQSVDEIVVGGGPLMDIEALNHILYSFIQGSKHNAIKSIYGCGIGPLYSAVYEKVVSEIIRLSDFVFLRDSNSTNLCRSRYGRKDVKLIGDPAEGFVKHFAKNLMSNNHTVSKQTITCYLRQWSKEYATGIKDDEYLKIKNNFEIELAKLIQHTSTKLQADVSLIPMHSFHVGGDDRVFNRKMFKSLKNKMNYQINYYKYPANPHDILNSMIRSKINICMRYHSVLFADVLGLPYMAIDYTNGGKIKSYLKDKNRLDTMISLKDIASGKWINSVNKIIDQYI